MSKVSAIVLTHNEARHIRDCLASLTWCDETWVVDSNSTDGTLDICKEYTTKIAQCPLVDFSALREWARVNLPLRNTWILFLDSDERITPELAQEIEARIDTEPYVAYNIPGRQFFWGQWLRFGEASPYLQLKLFHRDRGHYDDRLVHERVIIDGAIGFMRHPMLHRSRENMVETIDKLNRYTTGEAIRMYRTGQELYTPASGSYSQKNTVLKFIFRYLPAKPLMKFLYDYVIRQGFRDGYLGFVWAFCQGLYVFACYFKLWELKRGSVTIEELEARWKAGRTPKAAEIPPLVGAENAPPG